MSLFQQSHISPPSQDLSNNTGAMAVCAGVVCSLAVYSLALCCASQLKINTWILDSGATNHMTPNKHLLHNIQPLPFSYLVTLPNGYKVKVHCTGSLQLCNDLILSKVLLVPSFHFNLIFVPQLVDQLSCTAFFTRVFCHLQGPSLMRPLEIGRTHMVQFSNKCVNGVVLNCYLHLP